MTAQVKLSAAEMHELIEANVAAEQRDDLDAAMALWAPDPELEIAGLHIRGEAEMRAIKQQWINNWLPRWTGHHYLFGMFDEEKQMAVVESCVDTEFADGSPWRMRSLVVFEFENGKMKRERLYCMDPEMMPVVLETAGRA